jgi:hypothetical protein
LATCCLLAVLISLPLLADFQVVSAAGSPSPASVSLQPTDVPGFAPVDPSTFNFQDPNDSSFDQAFIACAGSTPLLSQFDTGPDADVSQAYGQGQNEFGTPQIVIATAVFSDGTTTDAQLAYNALSSYSFQSCWAQQSDALNSAQGLSVPASPTTVSPLASPRYGQGTSGFTLNFNYSVLGAPNSFSIEATSIWSGSLVTVLLVLTDQATFTESSRLALVKALAGRMDASSPPTACEPLNTPEPGNVLITTNQVIQDVSQTVSFQGETDSPNGGTAGMPVATSTCGWLNPHASPLVSILKPLPNGYLSASVSVTGPFASLQAASQSYQQTKATWEPGATTQSRLGQAAFYLPEQDDVSPLIVLDDQYLLTFGVESKGTEHSGELALAKTVLGILSAQIAAVTPPAPPPVCKTSLVPSLQQELQGFNSANEKREWKIASGNLDLPGGFSGKVALSMSLGKVAVCDNVVTFKNSPNTWLRTTKLLKAPELYLTTNPVASTAVSGPFIYRGSGLRWLLPKGSPSNSSVANRFDWQKAGFTANPSLDAELDVAHPTDSEIELDLGKFSVPTYVLSETLTSHSPASLRVTLGPTVAFTASASTKDIDKMVGELIAAGAVGIVAIDDATTELAAQIIEGIALGLKAAYGVIISIGEAEPAAKSLVDSVGPGLANDPNAVSDVADLAEVDDGVDLTVGQAVKLQVLQGGGADAVAGASGVVDTIVDGAVEVAEVAAVAA